MATLTSKQNFNIFVFDVRISLLGCSHLTAIPSFDNVIVSYCKNSTASARNPLRASAQTKKSLPLLWQTLNKHEDIKRESIKSV